MSLPDGSEESSYNTRFASARPAPMHRRRFMLATTGIGFAATTGSLSRWAVALAADRYPVSHSEAEWQHLLGPKRYAVLRAGATERPFSSPLLHERHPGEFACAGCGVALFSSDTKFDSGTGWPSFWAPLADAVVTRTDRSFGLRRTEVLCRGCGSHLGHVFHDGPAPTGLRYCMNGLALLFRSSASQGPA
jgi:peptide-methionine (R)-S-oxide reductase